MPEKTQTAEKKSKSQTKKAAPKFHIQNSKNFYSDLRMDDMIYARIIRSPKKSGILKSIEAKDLPEGYFFITAKNFPGKNSVETLGITAEIFCSEKILYEGQALALLAGPDRKVLNEIAADIKIEIEPVTAEKEKKVLSQNHIVIGGGRNKNISRHFNRAAFTVRNKWVYRLNSTPSTETNGALCNLEKENLIVYTPTHWPQHLAENLCRVFDIPLEKIFINKTVSSTPSTNSLWGNTILVCQICAGVMASKKPVKLQLSREEQEKIFYNAGEVAITHRTALTEEGIIQAASVDVDFDAGALNPFAQEIIDRLTIASCSIYDFENLEITAEAVASAKPPTSVNIETMDSAAFFAIENQFQKICSQTGFLPDEIRLANSKLLNEDQNKMPFVLHIERSNDTLQSVLRQSDFRRKFAAYKINSELSYDITTNYKPASTSPRGIGLSCAYDASGYHGTSIVEIPKTKSSRWNIKRLRGVPFESTSFVVIALELQINPCTFRTKIKNIWLTVSAGKITSIKEAETRIKFSIQKTLSELVENEKLDVEKISISFISSDAESKQIGTLIKKSLPAAFSMAIAQAINSNENFLPLKQDSLYNLLVQSKPAPVKEAKEVKEQKEGAQ